MTPAQLMQTYAVGGITTPDLIKVEVLKTMSRIELRIEDAYDRLPARRAHQATADDRKRLKEQVDFLAELERKS